MLCQRLQRDPPANGQKCVIIEESENIVKYAKEYNLNPVPGRVNRLMDAEHSVF